LCGKPHRVVNQPSTKRFTQNSKRADHGYASRRSHAPAQAFIHNEHFGPALNNELYGFGLAYVKLLDQLGVWLALNVPNLEPRGVVRDPFLHGGWSTGLRSSRSTARGIRSVPKRLANRLAWPVAMR
jgi:hypothetical protein